MLQVITILDIPLKPIVQSASIIQISDLRSTPHLPLLSCTLAPFVLGRELILHALSKVLSLKHQYLLHHERPQTAAYSALKSLARLEAGMAVLVSDFELAEFASDNMDFLNACLDDYLMHWKEIDCLLSTMASRREFRN